MNIAESKVYQLGKYTIRQRPHFDNPSFAQYQVFIEDRLIGKQFSVPTITDCEWLERAASTPQQPYTGGKQIRRRTHSTGGCNTRNATLLKPEPA